MRKSLLKFFIFTFYIFHFISISLAQDIKQPNVSGSFYPSESKELRQMIKDFLSQTQREEIPGEIFALLSPHAGYIYSGSVAAYGYKAIKDKDFDTVIILAPSHYVDFLGFAIWPKGKFLTPLGQIPVDEELAQKLKGLNSQVKDYPFAFEKEHALEVQLPFLQVVLKDFKIVPLIMGRFQLSDCELLAHSLKIILENKNALLVASTDLSHYHPYKEATALDNVTISFIKDNQPRALYEAVRKNEAELCGLGPVLTLLYYAKEKNLKLKLLRYANSGDVTGDWAAVVGYASFLAYEPEAREGEVGMLNKEQRRRLLEIARQSIKTYLESRKKLEVKESDPLLNKKMGAFVTLNEHGQLRGCIGNLIGEQPLYLTVRDMSIEAAVADPRFLPLQLSEIKDIEIEISVLSELEKISNPDLIELGKHGVLIRKGYHSGVFLPQVATETGWTKEEFLSHLCAHKAGLPADCWKDGSAEIYIFTAEVFSEKEY
ncbi:MAG: AmmeMemoRadiSam system protein B [Candidatus Omnitrophica bacterium]|nr:AmmeMemoRadiSam system protein B [Candidatus Omnitrophota bacterium]